jgi:hypothetical protein
MKTSCGYHVILASTFEKDENSSVSEVERKLLSARYKKNYSKNNLKKLISKKIFN